MDRETKEKKVAIQFINLNINMPKKVWTPEEKKAFGEKMRKAREVKKNPQKVEPDNKKLIVEFSDKFINECPKCFQRIQMEQYSDSNNSICLAFCEKDLVLFVAFTKSEEPKTEEPEVLVHTDEGTETPIPAFIKDIVNSYFSGAKLEVEDRGNDYFIKIIFSEEDTRAFVVDKPTASIEITNWCKKIKDKIEGKTVSKTAGMDTMTGIRTEMKKLPPELEGDENFFRE